MALKAKSQFCSTNLCIAYYTELLGQNLAREWGKWIENKEAGPEDSVRRWFIEKNYYTFGKFAYPMPSWMCRKEPCGHYTQVSYIKKTSHVSVGKTFIGLIC